MELRKPDQARDLAERLVATAGDAIVIADPQGRIITWNRGAESVFGFPAAEALGNSLDLIIPERLRARHWDGFHQTMRTGTTRYADDLLAVPAQRRDGTRISIEFRVTLLQGPDGTPEAIAAVIRDVTSRWEADRALRKELEQLRASAGPSPSGEEATAT
ncbi:MAG: PAS domain-containing protein [Acidimicrobiaceae bacterium]|nr:PAS domain-containing protein [Acidimicrobiaceae bacterium]